MSGLISYYDLVSIGTGFAGKSAVIQAKKSGAKEVCVIDKGKIGGGGIMTDVIPSKAMWETVRLHHLNGKDAAHLPSISELLARAREVTNREIAQTYDEFTRNHVEIVHGRATFEDAHTLSIDGGKRKITAKAIIIAAKAIIIAVGSKPNRPPGVQFNDCIIDSDQIFSLEKLPRRLTIIGGGIVGIEYACMFAAYGVEVVVIDRKEEILTMCDSSISSEAREYMENHFPIEFILGESVKIVQNERDSGVKITLESDREIITDVILYSIGRRGTTESLGLENTEVQTDKRGNIIAVNEFGQTHEPSIYAAGDVLAYAPQVKKRALTLASTAIQEGRLAALHALDETDDATIENYDIACSIFTIPEIAFVGSSQEQLLEKRIPFVIGRANFSELPRGHIIHDDSGFLNLIVERKPPHRILGVHIFGSLAYELIYTGQNYVRYGTTVYSVANDVFQTPSLHRAYQVAAFRVRNELKSNKRS